MCGPNVPVEKATRKESRIVKCGDIQAESFHRCTMVLKVFENRASTPRQVLINAVIVQVKSTRSQCPVRLIGNQTAIELSKVDAEVNR